MTMQTESTTTTEQQTAAPADDQQQQQQAQQTEQQQHEAAQTEGQQEGQQEGQEQRERDDKGRFKPAVQQRINELTRQRHEAQREAETLRQQLQQLQGGAPSSGQVPATEPQPDQFQDYGQYVKALAKWEAAQIVGARDQAQAQTLQQRAQQAEQQAQQAQAQAWIERQETARTALPDYDTVMQAATVPVSPALRDELLDSDAGPQLAYHLAKNPSLAHQLNGLSGRALTREIARLEVTLSRPATPPVSNAPKPLRPIAGGGGAAPKPEAQMSDSEWYAARNAQRRK